MTSVPMWRRYLRLHGPDIREDVDDELRFHLEMRTQDLIASGMDPEQAQTEAMRRFGDVTEVRRKCEEMGRGVVRDEQRRERWGSVLRDVRFAGRSLRRNPGFALVAILTLALGIGANTAIFSVINSVLLRPLPYADPDRLVTVFHFYPSLNNLEAGAAVPSYGDLRRDSRIFDGVAVQGFWGVNFTGAGEPERLNGSRVSGEYFSVYGVRPLLGRTLLPEDVEAGRQQVVLSHSFWQRAFGGDRGVIGRTMQINGEAYEIIGVMPAGFRDFFASSFGSTVDVWGPTTFNPNQFTSGRTNEFLSMTARMKPGVSEDEARRELTAFAERLKTDNPGSYPADWTLRLRSLAEQGTGKLRPALLVLLGAVGFVLLIACANVANLLLARAAARRKEVAIRSALGARSGDLVRQFLIESLLLSLAGGVLGLALAYGAIRLLVGLNPAHLPWVKDVSMDTTVLAFTFGIAVLTGILFGLVPALQFSRTGLQSTLREGGRSVTGDVGGVTARRTLVVAEIALALVLLTGAGLMIRSFARIQRVDPGFNPERVLTMNLILPSSKYASDTAQIAFFDEVLPRIAAIPGVQGVGANTVLPFSGGGSTRSFTIEGLELAEGQPDPWGDFRIVDPNFHRTMQIPLLRGRLFTDSDRMGSRPVAIVDQEMVRRYWANQDPIGKRLAFGTPEGEEPEWIEVVGVVGHAAQEGLDADPRVQLYLPYKQAAAGSLSFVVRSSGDPTQLVGPIRAAVRSVDPDQPIAEISTMEELLRSSVGQRRFSMLLLGFFAAIALVLAAVGIYGLMSFDVARRVPEIGVRMALGAETGSVLRLMLVQGLRLALIGVGIGLLGAFAVSRLIANQLYSVQATDPITLGSVVLLLIGIAALAMVIPAYRATRVDPLVALRAE